MKIDFCLLVGLIHPLLKMRGVDQDLHFAELDLATGVEEFLNADVDTI